MSPFIIILLAIIAVAAIYAVMTYNSLVAVKHNVARAWANIDVLLKQRHDEIPKLVEICKQYRQFEQDTLQKVIEARSKVFNASQAQNVGDLGKAETQLRGSLANLFAVAEAYPDLKTSEQFRNLQIRISSLESAIADRREFYNDTVNVNNVRIEQFPAALIANLFDFPPRHPLEFRADEKTDVDMRKLFAA